MVMITWYETTSWAGCIIMRSYPQWHLSTGGMTISDTHMHRSLTGALIYSNVGSTVFGCWVLLSVWWRCSERHNSRPTGTESSKITNGSCSSRVGFSSTSKPVSGHSSTCVSSTQTTCCVLWAQSLPLPSWFGAAFTLSSWSSGAYGSKSWNVKNEKRTTSSIT